MQPPDRRERRPSQDTSHQAQRHPNRRRARPGLFPRRQGRSHALRWNRQIPSPFQLCQPRPRPPVHQARQRHDHNRRRRTVSQEERPDAVHQHSHRVPTAAGFHQTRISLRPCVGILDFDERVIRQFSICVPGLPQPATTSPPPGT